MKKTEFMSKVTRAFGKAGLKIKEHSPEILVTTGVVGTVVSAVMACKATTKIGDILDGPVLEDREESAKEVIDAVHESVERHFVNSKTNEVYTQKDANKDLLVIYTKIGLKFARLYAPSIILGATSITCIFAGNNMLRKRAVALAAAYTAIDKGFKEYRERVIDRFGEEVDKELRYNVKVKEIEKTMVDDDGNETTVKETVKVASTSDVDYARCFDETNPNFEKDAQLNHAFLRCQQQYANDKLIAQGYLFLNDVYELLGYEKTKPGQVVGWVYDPNNQEIDSYVDFGMYHYANENCREFLNGHERAIWLDFNVDGPILNALPEKA